MNSFYVLKILCFVNTFIRSKRFFKSSQIPVKNGLINYWQENKRDCYDIGAAYYETRLCLLIYKQNDDSFNFRSFKALCTLYPILS